jgi:hypothetical protein
MKIMMEEVAATAAQQQQTSGSHSSDYKYLSYGIWWQVEVSVFQTA